MAEILPSWRNTASRQRIIDFVVAVTDASRPRVCRPG